MSDDADLPDWLPDAVPTEEAKDLLSDPKGYVLGLVAVWVVNNLVLQPTLFVVEFTLDAGAYAAGLVAFVRSRLALAVAPVGRALLAAVAAVRAIAVDAAAEAGVAAPVAAAVVNVLLAFVAVAVVVLAVRVALDAIPGGGGLR